MQPTYSLDLFPDNVLSCAPHIDDIKHLPLSQQVIYTAYYHPIKDFTFYLCGYDRDKNTGIGFFYTGDDCQFTLVDMTSLSELRELGQKTHRDDTFRPRRADTEPLISDYIPLLENPYIGKNTSKNEINPTNDDDGFIRIIFSKNLETNEYTKKWINEKGKLYSLESLIKNQYGVLEKNGLDLSWHSNGVLSHKGLWSQDVRVGKHSEWHPNGSVKSETYYRNGSIEGAVCTWNETGGLVSLEEYKNGRRDGFSFIWNDNGQLLMDCTYKDGKLDGTYRRWYSNGQPAVECTYKDDERDGTSRRWNENGRLLATVEFQKGEKVSFSSAEKNKSSIPEQSHHKKKKGMKL